MCSGQRCKNEFQVKNFLLGYDQPQHFVQFEWGWPKVYSGWRCFWAVYHLTCIIVSGFMSWQWASSKANEIKWFIYLTDWTYFVLTMATILDFIAVVYIQLKRTDILEGRKENLTWYEKITWMVCNIANCSSVVITILYWGLLYKAGTVITAVDAITHAVNSVYVLINITVTAMPVRLFHVFHTMIYFFIYVIFSLIYQKVGGTNGVDKTYIYSIIDWDADPGTAVVYSVLVIFIATPAVHISLFLIQMLRIAAFSRILNKHSVEQDETLTLRAIDKP